MTYQVISSDDLNQVYPADAAEKPGPLTDEPADPASVPYDRQAALQRFFPRWQRDHRPELIDPRIGAGDEAGKCPAPMPWARWPPNAPRRL